MDVIPMGGSLSDLKTEVLFIFGFQGEGPEEVMRPIEELPRERLSALLEADFRGRKREVIPIITGEESSIERIVVLGLGGKVGFGLDGFRKAGAYARKHAEEKGYRDVYLGRNVLRVETAAAGLLAAIRAWEDRSKLKM